MPRFWYFAYVLELIYTVIQLRIRFQISYIYISRIRLYFQWTYLLSELYMTVVITYVPIILILENRLQSSQEIPVSIMWIINFSDCFLSQGHIWRWSMKNTFILVVFRSEYILNVMEYMLLIQKQYAHMMGRMLFLPKERLIKVII
jgi:hypothetical protein